MLSHASSPFFYGYFGHRVLLFFPDQSGPQPFYFKFHTFTGMSGIHHHAQLSFEMESQTFCLDLPQTMIFLISACQIATIIGMINQCPVGLTFLKTYINGNLLPIFLSTCFITTLNWWYK
jgi:hypothetical protein